MKANAGDRIGPYVLDRLLGAGGMGQVWRAWDETLARWVALKLMVADDPQDRRRFLREAQTAAALVHPNIATVYECGEHGGRSFIAMLLIDGAPLRAGRDARETARALRDAALAVAHAHERGIVHRDLKPDNIMADRTGRIYVTDFGLARQVEAASSLTVSGCVIGTPAYMSPEQARGEPADARSDVYALGATLHHLLSGSPPFGGSTIIELLSQVIHDDPPPLAHAPPELRAIVARCLEKDPARRYPTAAGLADDLTRFLDGRPVGARLPGPLERLRRGASRHRALVAALAVALAGGVAVLAFVLPRVVSRERRLARAVELDRLAAVVEDTRPFLYVKDVDIRAKLDDVRAATEALSRVEPKDAEVWTLLGLGWHFTGDLARAEAALVEAERLAPDDARVQFALGKLLYERSLRARLVERPVDDDHGPQAERAAGHVSRARGRLRGADEIDIDVAEIYCLYAEGRGQEAGERCLAGLRRFGSAIGAEEYWNLLGMLDATKRVECYTKALEVRPHYGWAFFMRGLARSARDEHEAAVDDFSRAIALNPHDAEAHLSRGTARAALRDFAGTVEDCTAALRLRPGFAIAFANRANARAELGQTDGALADYAEALRIDPRHAGTRRNRAALRLRLGDRDGALADYTEAIALRPDADALVNRASLLREAGRLDEAIADCDEALKRRPGMPEALANRGLARAARGDRADALRDLDAAVARGATHENVLLERAGLRGNPRAALADLDEAVRLHPGSARARTNRGAVRDDLGDRDGALADYAEAIRLDPACVGAHVNRAAIRLVAGDLDAALADCEAAIRIGGPLSALAWHKRGVIRHRRGDEDGARADWEQALRVDPACADAVMDLASRRDPDGALELYDRALRAAPRSARLLINRGHLHRTAGRLDQALADLDAAVAADPSQPLAFANRGAVHRERGAMQRAMDDFTEALRLDPRCAFALSNRGTLLYAAGRHADALADYDACVRLDPSSFEYRFNRGLARGRLNDVAGAIEDFDEAIRLKPDHPALHLERGMAWHGRGDLVRAIADYTAVLRIDPNHAGALNNRGIAHYNRGDLPAALADLDRALDLRPDAPTHVNRAAARTAHGDVDGAIADYTAALKLRPADPESLNNRALLHERKGDTEAALADYARALRIEPKYVRAWHNRGSLRLERGDVDAAVADFDEALRLNPRLPEPYAARGKAKARKGDRAAAAADFARALDVAPAGWPHRSHVEQLLREARGE